MRHDDGPSDSSRPAPSVSGDEARRIAAELLVAHAMKHAHVEFGIGKFWDAPKRPVWLVRPASRTDSTGTSELFAICPDTGRLLFHGRE